MGVHTLPCGYALCQESCESRQEQVSTSGGFRSPDSCLLGAAGLPGRRLTPLPATAACARSFAALTPLMAARAGASLGGGGGGLSGIQKPLTVE